ncbi:MAG: hypothetical protein J5I81_12835 [Nitrococcus mobilis]|nr:hypothetical protein [Nitrococcus mobilis]
MGVFDAPAPIFAWLDAQTAMAIPPLGRLILWGSVAALISMGLYRALSAQERIGRTKIKLTELRQRLEAHDGDFADATPLIGNLLRTALQQVGLVAWPALLSSLPLLTLVCWLSTAYGYTYPAPGSTPTIQTMPPHPYAKWIEGVRDDAVPEYRPPPHILIADRNQTIVADISWRAPVPIVHKWQWWNALVGNPIGYLPSDAPVDRIEVALPGKKYLGFGPQWLRGWETPFFFALLVVSIVTKIGWQID